ncbi:MAG: FCD domain-containing protein [Candidatus Bipolaricaulota bacterium]|nr:FadR family transcriptional regulator [Candidatus Bipolaricaulota bacterium]MBS3791103.1 FadR family transcriptional regulator [Candidatus Bipolaricaulota bacterium]
MEFEFQKLEQRKKPLHVASQLVSAIKAGNFEVGDKLPTEEELSERTGVSRASVREALAALRLGGIIETKVGKGTFVRQVPEEDTVREKLIKVLIDNPKPLELQEARTAFEVGVVQIAAKKFSEDDEQKLEATLDEMGDAARNDNYQEFLDLHKRFHLQVAGATRNDVIEDTLKNLQGIMNDTMWRKLEKMHYLPDKREYLMESLRIHREIFIALKKNDPVLAGKRIKSHFERYS